MAHGCLTSMQSVAAEGNSFPSGGRYTASFVAEIRNTNPLPVEYHETRCPIAARELH